MDAMLVAFLEHIPDGIVLIDSDHRVQYVNRLAMEWLAIDVDNSKGQYLSTLPYGDTLEYTCSSHPDVIAIGHRSFHIQAISINHNGITTLPASTFILIREATTEEACRWLFRMGHQDFMSMLNGGLSILLST